jgi:hypothetical protein
LRRCQHVDSFVKLEDYPEFKEARWINSRSDAFKAYSGRFFKAIEDEVYQNPWFIKHVPVPDRPKLIASLRQSGLYYYENDYKAYESHMVSEFMEVCELELYRYALADYPGDARFICSVIGGTNRLHTRCGVKASLKARRMSGDMCTSLGNGFTNLMIVLFLIHRANGDYRSVRGFVEGDDGLFASPVALTAQDFKALGFTVEIKRLDDPTDGHFCGCSCAGDIVLRDPRKVFQRFGWTSSFIHAGNGVVDQLLRWKALSLCHELPDCPVLGVLARTALAITEGLEARAPLDNWKKIPKDYAGPLGPFAPTTLARVKMQRLFGISIDTQLRAESAIRNHDMVELARLIPAKSDSLIYSCRYVEKR